MPEGAQRARLLKLSEAILQRGWWDGYAEEVHGALMDYVWLENRTSEIRSFGGIPVHGLLRTREYARAIIAAEDPDTDAEQIECWVELRMLRQHITARS